MNSTPPALPGLRLLYQRDITIERAINTIVAAFIGAAGILWATQPSQSPPPGVDLSFELMMNQWAPLGGAVVAALGGIVLWRRHGLVKRILTQGTTLKATVADLEISTHTLPSDTASPMRRPTQRAYYATLHYSVNGMDQTVCLRLPHAGFVYGLVKGQQTDVMVLEWMPRKPLIRSVYLGQA